MERSKAWRVEVAALVRPLSARITGDRLTRAQSVYVVVDELYDNLRSTSSEAERESLARLRDEALAHVDRMATVAWADNRNRDGRPR